MGLASQDVRLLSNILQPARNAAVNLTTVAAQTQLYQWGALRGKTEMLLQTAHPRGPVNHLQLAVILTKDSAQTENAAPAKNQPASHPSIHGEHNLLLETTGMPATQSFASTCGAKVMDSFRAICAAYK